MPAAAPVGSRDEVWTKLIFGRGCFIIIAGSRLVPAAAGPPLCYPQAYRGRYSFSLSGRFTTVPALERDELSLLQCAGGRQLFVLTIQNRFMSHWSATPSHVLFTGKDSLFIRATIDSREKQKLGITGGFS